MKKMLFMLLTIILMISVSACSSRAGNGDVAQTQNEDKTTEKPNGEKKEGTKPSGGKKTIVFSTLYHYELVEEAKKKYEAKHPNITIEIKYKESGDGASEKFVKTTNTAMLSGKGPDLIEMDQLPIEKYVKKNLLANISEIIEKDPTFKKEQYFNNILDNVKINVGIYGMPLSFIMYGLMGNETLIEKSGVKFDDKTWNWSQYTDVIRQVMKFGEKNSKYGLLGFPDAVLNEMVKDQYPTFVDEVNGKVNFDSEPFTTLIKQVKSLSDEQTITEDYQGHSLFSNSSIVSPTNYWDLLKESELYPTKLYAKPKANGQQAGGYFRPYISIGINEKSSVKEEAWDFLKFMLSDEMLPGGFPLNKIAYEKQVQQQLKEGKVKSDQPSERMKGEVTAKDIQELDQFLSGAIHPVAFRPSKVEEIISEESKAYFSGQKSAEEVAKLIQNRVTTFVNE